MAKDKSPGYIDKDEAEEAFNSLKRLNKLLAEKGGLMDKISDAQAQELATSQAIVANLEQQSRESKARVEDIKEQLSGEQKLTEATRRRLNKEKAHREELMNWADARRSVAAKAAEKHETEIAAWRTKKMKEREAAAEEGAIKMQEQYERAFKTPGLVLEKSLKELTTADALGGLKAAGTAVKKSIEDVARSPELLLAGFYGLGTNLKSLNKEIKRLPVDLENSMTGMVKNTGMPIKQLGQNLVDALDPEYALRMGVAFDRASFPMAEIGLKVKDVEGAMSSLLSETAIFRPQFLENERAAAAFVSNTVAGLSKLGVKTTTSAKIIDTMTKAMKTTPIEAAKSLGSITNIADSLGLNMGKVAENFSTLTPQLSQFGSRMTEVFADLQAQAQATGVEISRLAEFAMGLDTFDNAAKAAQSLNAVLGQSAIAVTDLVHADPADKIAMIQDAIAGAGIDFESADRRMKQVIATAAGFKNVEEASRVLLNKEEAEESAKAVDTSQMKQDEFTNRIKQSMTTAEKMTSSVNKMAGGMKKVLGSVRPAAEEFSKGVSRGFSNMALEAKNSYLAVTEMMGILDVTQGVKEKGAIWGDKFTEALKARFPVRTFFAEMAGEVMKTGAKVILTSEGEDKVGIDPDLTQVMPVTPGRGALEDRVYAGAQVTAPTGQEPVVAQNVVEVYLDGKKVGGTIAPVVKEQIRYGSDPLRALG